MRLFIFCMVVLPGLGLLYGWYYDNEAKKESERIKSEFNLIEGKLPTSIPTEIITFNGFCKEIDNPNSFYFEEEDNWKHQHFGRNAEFLNNRPDELFISYKNIEGDRIDKEIPPNFCKTDYEVDLSSDDVFEDISLTCTREIKGDNGGFIERDYEAVCSIEITERLDCIPDKYFEQNENVSSWINENKYLACSSENIDEYRRQVKARWEQTGD